MEWNTNQDQAGTFTLPTSARYPDSQTPGVQDCLTTTIRSGALPSLDDGKAETMLWQNQYNNVLPHSSLNYLPPVAFSRQAA